MAKDVVQYFLKFEDKKVIIFLKLYQSTRFDFELNGSAGLYFLSGTQTYLRDVLIDPPGITIHKGHVDGAGLWPGGILGINTIFSKRIKNMILAYDLDTNTCLKALFMPPTSTIQKRLKEDLILEYMLASGLVSI